MLWILSAGCAVDYGISDEIAADPGAPVITIDSALWLEAPLDEVVEGTVRVTNIGTATLNLDGAWIDEEDFTLLDLPDSLEPETEGTITVAFTPTTLSADGRLTLHTNDPDRPEVVVSLGGEGLVPDLVLSPASLTFDGVLLGCETTEILTLSNNGEAALFVSALTPALSGVTAQIDLPVTIEPGGSVDAALTFTPDEARLYLGEVSVDSSDPAGAQTSTVEGQGSRGATVEERFRQGGGVREGVDLMFYIDQSGSMSDEQQFLADEALGMLESLQATDVDYQVMVVTNSDGCHSGEIITPDTINAENVFVDALNGNSHSYTEMGLTLSRLALEETESSGGCNNGFLRDGVTPSLVLISDEPEQSSAGWNNVLSDILDIEPRTLISAIAGDYPNGCSSATAGDGYYQATEATGGVFLSICDTDWAAHIDEIVQTSAEIVGDPTDTFALSQQPELATLVVTVDGVVALSGWSYDAAINAIVFDTLPAPDTVIVITFSNLCQP